MKKTLPLLLLAAFAASVAFADDKAKGEAKPNADDKPKAEAKANAIATATAGEKPKAEDKQMSGISILGNQDSPKSLVIVPWKSSEIGAGVGLANSLNDRAAPVDRDVFARQLRYYAIRTGGAGGAGN
jgi:hypothetical protein